MQAIRVTFRVLLGIFGGYAASAAISAALAVALYRWCGFDRGQSTVLCSMLGFAFYLFALLWALTTRGLGRAAALIVGSCALGYAVVRWLSPASVMAAASILPLGVRLM